MQTAITDDIIRQFLSTHQLASPDQLIPIQGDASPRAYMRLIHAGRSYILMDARRDKENFSMFVSMAEYLRGSALNAPEIYGADHDHGLMLLEDFGNGNYQSLFHTLSPATRMELYTHATDVLVQLHQVTLPNFAVEPYHQERLMKELSQFTTWYLPQMIQDPIKQHDAKQAFTSIWEELLHQLHTSHEVVVLRDYHSPNLMWMPERPQLAKVGLLDFQDAVIGSKAYDVVSLIEDARVDISKETTTYLLDYYLQSSTLTHKEHFLAEIALLGAQRNCKILGFLTRKLVQDNNRNYLPLHDRMWRYLERDCSHPALASLTVWFDRYVPVDKRELASLLQAVGSTFGGNHAY